MDRADIQSCPPSLSPGIPHPERGRTRAPELNEGSLKQENKHCPKNTQQSKAPGTRRPATASVSQVLGAILTPALVSTLQIGQAPNSSFLVSMYWQINEMGAHTPP